MGGWEYGRVGVWESGSMGGWSMGMTVGSRWSSLPRVLVLSSILPSSILPSTQTPILSHTDLI
jgi:hypothetical protein